MDDDHKEFRDTETDKDLEKEIKKNDKSLSKKKGIENKLNQVLKEYGFAIITNALSSIIELETMRTLFAKDLMSIIDKNSDPLNVAKIAVDPISNFPLDEILLGYNFCSDFGLPQGRLAWHVRTHPRIKRIFASIYDDEDL